MTIQTPIPGLSPLQLEHLILDVNGTLTDRGKLLSDVTTRVERLRESLSIHLVSADTFGTLDAIAEELGVRGVRVDTGQDKLRILDELGRDRCAVVGNGRNDVPALQAAALAIAVLGPEGTSTAALGAADVVCPSAAVALDLLLDTSALVATLRP